MTYHKWHYYRQSDGDLAACCRKSWGGADCHPPFRHPPYVHFYYVILSTCTFRSQHVSKENNITESCLEKYTLNKYDNQISTLDPKNPKNKKQLLLEEFVD